jgi:prepilin-type N-terminal cleavage/methylation domain-containing protein
MKRRTVYRHAAPWARAFTLIEMLTVVAIITLLIAILLPLLQGARASAKTAVCQSNLRQIAIAWQLYLDGNGGRFYQAVNADLYYGGWVGSQGVGNRPLNRHLRMPATLDSPESVNSLTCPNDNGSVPQTTLPCLMYYGTSYRTNILLIGQNQIGPGLSYLKNLHKEINARLKNLKVSAIDSPSKVVLVGDYGWVNEWVPKCPFRTEWHSKPACHNVAFLDTHAEFVKIRKGMYVTETYRVLPFDDLQKLAWASQREETQP